MTGMTGAIGSGMEEMRAGTDASRLFIFSRIFYLVLFIKFSTADGLRFQGSILRFTIVELRKAEGAGPVQ